MSASLALRSSSVRRIVLGSTTAVVVGVGAATLRLLADAPGRRFDAALGGAAVLYLGVLAWRLARRPDDEWPPPLGPFVLAGLLAATVLRLVVGKYRIDGDLGLAAAAGLLVGLAHGTAVSVWMRLRTRREPG
jgi:hypothetical protein